MEDGVGTALRPTTTAIGRLSMTTDEIIELTTKHVMNTYGRQPVAFVRGKGCRLWDAEGEEYLDFLAGIAVCSVGHAHEGIAKALADQAKRLLHTSNLYHIAPQSLLAKELCRISFADKVFFCNSGMEANEAAIKLARKHSLQHFGEGRAEIITAEHSFHGRSLGTLAATAKYHRQDAFAPLAPGFKHVPWDDAEALRAAITPQTCAVLLEPVQGEGGVHVPSPGYLQEVRAICDELNLLLILDEVQTGMGRTGKWFAYEHFGVAPDIMTLAKALGSGVPIGACLATDEVASAFEPGDHATTFGGNYLASVAGLATIEAMEKGDMLANATARGEQLAAGLDGLAAKYEAVHNMRGLGLLRAFDIAGDVAPAVQAECFKRRLIVIALGTYGIRLAPPLIVSEADSAEALSIIDDAVGAVVA
jgi:acetylornithine/N-succinyldiaminopimelate aminotransferase